MLCEQPQVHCVVCAPVAAARELQRVALVAPNPECTW